MKRGGRREEGEEEERKGRKEGGRGEEGERKGGGRGEEGGKEGRRKDQGVKGQGEDANMEIKFSNIILR